MKLNFKNIKIENFLSLGKVEVNLADNGYTFVTGVNENPSDNALSNGSGKSSIWEAISWCLCGETIRGNCKDIVNLNTDGGALVELNFNVDAKEYKIIRTKEHKEYKTTLKIFIDGEDMSGKGIRDSEKLLNEYLPDLTSSLIGSVIILGQGMPQRFSNNTPSGRKEVLEKLSKSDFMIQDLKNRISNRKSKLSEDLRTVEDNILKQTTTLSICEQNKSKDENLLDSFKNVVDYAALLEEAKKALFQSKEEETQLNSSLVLTNEAIERCYNESRNLSAQRDTELTAIDTKYKEPLQEYINICNDLYTSYQIAETKLRELEKITDICPTCKQKLPDVHKPNTDEARHQVEFLNQQYLAQKQLRDTLQEEYFSERKRVEEEFKSKDSSITIELNSLKQQKLQLEKSISSVVSTIQSQNNSINSIQNNIDNLQRNIDECNSRLSEIKLQIEALTQDILYNNNVKSDLQTRLDIISKFNTVVTRDFRGYLLLNVIKFINEKAKEYSQDIFETDRIEFKLDGNLLSITYDGKQYETLSGGEKQKVDIIIQFAIRDMMCKFLGFSSNILVVDEIFDNLDRIGCEKVINLISTKLSDISSVYIISHHSDIDIPYDRELVVVKDANGVSKIR